MAIDLQAEFIDQFLNADNPFRESVVYTASGAASKTIYGIVNRSGIKKTSGADKTPSTWDYELLISHDATDGIATVTKGMDVVAISSPEVGGTNIFVVAGIISRTGMCWHLGLRS